jgi:hypothetical protein
VLDGDAAESVDETAIASTVVRLIVERATVDAESRVEVPAHEVTTSVASAATTRRGVIGEH